MFKTMHASDGATPFAFGVPKSRRPSGAGLGFLAVASMTVVGLTSSCLGQGSDTPSGGTTIAVPGSSTGTTVGFINDTSEACPYAGSTSPDVFYAYSPGATQEITLDLCESGYDSQVYVYDSNLSLVIRNVDLLPACNDDACSSSGGGGFRSFLDCVPVNAGQLYFIAIDGSSGAAGPYSIVTSVTDPVSCEASIGALHNALLECYYQKDPLPPAGRLARSDVEAAVTVLVECAIEIGLALDGVDRAVLQVIGSLDELNLFYESDGLMWYGSPVVSDEFVPYVANYVAESRFISGELSSAIDTINAMVVNRDPSAEILAHVTGDFAEQSWPPLDRQAVDIFVDVFGYSSLYWNVDGELDDTDVVILADAGGALYGLLCGPFAGVWSPIEGAIFSIIANHATSTVAPQDDLDFQGSSHTALGEATLNLAFDQLVAYRYDSLLDDGDGVAVQLNDAHSFAMDWEPLDLGTDGFVEAHAAGTVDGLAGQSLGVTRVTRRPSDYEITADYSALGSPTQWILVYNGEDLVASFPGHTGPVGTTLVPPTGCDKGTIWPYPPVPCYTWDWPIPILITVGGEDPVVGDTLLVLAETDVEVGTLQEFSIQAAGVPSISVIGETQTFLSGLDCNDNGQDDFTDIISGESQDVDGDGVPDECGWNDDFDDYLPGPLVPNDLWEPWEGNPAFATADVTTDLWRSAPHSVAIDLQDDVVRRYGYGPGRWRFTAWQYVPSSLEGQSYIILLNNYAPPGPYNASVQLFADGDAGMIEDLDTGDTLPLIRDQWVEIRMDIDLDADTVSVFYDGTLLVSKSWQLGGGGSGAPQPVIDALDLFGNGASPVYYDDLSLVAIPSCPGDLDVDGEIGFADLLNVLSNWGPCVACPADLDGDGVVGFQDLLQILSSWGPCD